MFYLFYEFRSSFPFLQETTQFRLADPLSSVHKWVRSARVLDAHQRIALVRAREGLSLELSLATKPLGPSGLRNSISFVHNSSQLGDFTAMLVSLDLKLGVFCSKFDLELKILLS